MNVALGERRRWPRAAARRVAETALAVAGLALILGALGLPQPWLDRHFLPILFVSHKSYFLGESLARLAVAALGAWLALGARPRLGRLIAGVPPRTLALDAARIAFAVLLALATSELILRATHPRAKEEPPAAEEPRRLPDERLGWIFAPVRTARATVGGRDIDYAIDAAGYRVRRADMAVNPDLPTVVFAGESIMAGYGLRWEETIPTQVEALLGVQSANLAVFGYASDQAYLRLAQELPRFRRPLAVVSLFMPPLFDRNLDDDRPHLGPGLAWLPPVKCWRLMALVKWLVPYRSGAAIERGIAATRAVLGATAALARARGAMPLIVVPQFGPEAAMERSLRRRILDDAGLPYVAVTIDPAWHLPGDAHPDARDAHAIALAVAARLRQRTEPEPPL